MPAAQKGGCDLFCGLYDASDPIYQKGDERHFGSAAVVNYWFMDEEGGNVLRKAHDAGRA